MAEIIPIPGFYQPFSSLSHLLGAVVFAGFSLPLLLRGRGDGPRLTSLAIFCLGTVTLLTISGTYHLLDPAGSARPVIRRLDHAAIFVLIACSFTPSLIILFRGRTRWGILSLVWLYAIVAIVFKLAYFDQISSRQGLAMYLLMGAIGIFPCVLLSRLHGWLFLKPILFGGLAYALGGTLESFHWPIMVPGVIQWHEVFHIAVLIGLGFHWAFVFTIADGGLGVVSPEIALTSNIKHPTSYI